MIHRIFLPIFLLVGLATVTPTATFFSDDSDWPYELNQRLLQSILRNSESQVRKNLKDGASAKARDEFEHTALMIACMRGSEPIVKLLLKEGAEINATDPENNTALIYAIKYGLISIARFLIVDYHADVNLVNQDQDSALSWAAYRGSLPLVKLLLDHGAVIDNVNRDGITPLFEAISRNHVAVVKALVEHGANINAHHKGISAIAYAKKLNFSAIVDILRNHQAVEDPLDDDMESDQAILMGKIKALPIDIAHKKELTRIVKQLDESHPHEKATLKEYLNLVFSLPWDKTSPDTLDITNARRILDEDHTGLEDVKEKIIDFMTLLAMKKDGKAPILCLVGPPGVGKTSIATSVARALGRKFERISLGGMHDESQLRGHVRTYIGALPGRFIQVFKKTNTLNPVILLDEIDKVNGGGYHGDPASALLEALDPEQNSTFTDNYLALPFDLSKTIFIATANDPSRIPAPLRDRMTFIEISSYSDYEKIAIATNHLVPETLNNLGLQGIIKPNEIMSPAILEEIIRKYAKGGGIRHLKRLLALLATKKAREYLTKGLISPITKDDIEKHLDKYESRDHLEKEHKNLVGVVNGLAYNGTGSGTLIKLEMILVPRLGKDPFTVVDRGKAGEGLFKEGLETAYYYVASQSKRLGISIDAFKDNEVRVNIANGYTPIDGPSAGMAKVSGLVSVFTGRPINGNYAMTGTVNLRGEAGIIGGVDEKLHAAKDNGMEHVIFPEANRKDVERLDAKAREGIDIIFVKHVDEVLKLVLI